MSLVDWKLVLVPDLYGNRACTDCHGYGWRYSYHNGQSTHITCETCEGWGWFSEETTIVPVEGGAMQQQLNPLAHARGAEKLLELQRPESDPSKDPSHPLELYESLTAGTR